MAVNSTMSILNNMSNIENTTYYDDYDDCYTVYCIYVVRYRHAIFKTLVWLTSLLSIMGLVGCVGNTLVIVVFLRSSSKHNSMYLMLLLAFIDLLVCIFFIPGLILREWRFEFYYDALCKSLEFVRYFTIPTSAMILVAIAVDRFILICTPPHIMMSKFVTKVVMTVILSIGLGFGVPPVLAKGVFALSYSGQMLYTGFCVSNYMHISVDFLNKYWYLVTALFGFMILAIIILYSLIFVTVYKQNKKWQQLRNNKIVPRRFVDKQKDDDTSMFGERAISIDSASLENTNKTTMDEDSRCRKSSVFRTADALSFSDQRADFHPRYSSRSKSDFSGLPSPQDINDHRFSFDVKRLRHLVKQKTIPLKTLNSDTLNSLSHTRTIKVEEVHLTNQRSISMVQATSPWNKLSTVKETSQAGTSGMSQNSASPQAQRNNRLNAKTSFFLRGPFLGTSKLSRKNSSFLQTKGLAPTTRSRPAHIKTTQVLFTVSMIYVISFLPTFLMSNGIIPTHKVIYYMYLLNNAANPIIYSFMNPRFRQEVKKLFRRKNR